MEAILEVIRNYLRENLSPERFEHCLGVEKMSRLLAVKFSLSPEKCSLAGLAHDICREMPDEKLLTFLGCSHDTPLLLHGHAGAKMLREIFSITDNSILDAVKYHISGSAGLDDVGKIVFAADFMEEGRCHLNDDDRKRLFLLDLDDMVLDIALQISRFLDIRGVMVDPQLKLFINDLQKEKLFTL